MALLRVYRMQTARRRLRLLLTRRVDSFAPLLHHLHQGSHDARGRGRSGRGRVLAVSDLREDSHDLNQLTSTLDSPVAHYISVYQGPVHFTVNKVCFMHNM